MSGLVSILWVTRDRSTSWVFELTHGRVAGLVRVSRTSERICPKAFSWGPGHAANPETGHKTFSKRALHFIASAISSIMSHSEDGQVLL